MDQNMKLKRISYRQLLQNMGWRYVLFRLWYAFQRLTGLLKLRFPKHRERVGVTSVQSWKDLSAPFFFQSKACLQQRAFSKLSIPDLNQLKQIVQDIEQGRFRLFYHAVYQMEGWHVHPMNGFIFNRDEHWSNIPTLSPIQGDIKYVWDKSRFGFLYDIIRYDWHTGHDKSKLVMDQIQDWILQNPVNCGPNWTFALHYYKNASALDENTFQNILNSIFRQTQHIFSNMSFAQFSVRNNHILTESLALYVVGTCYPFFEDSLKWKARGREVFQSEICTQINDTGTYLQHSMNYHRMVIQLLSWAIRLATLNGEAWSDTLYDRARKSVLFLKACQDPITGWLPNYGHNDGSLIFSLTSNHFRDFKPQIETLSILLKLKASSGSSNEELHWISADHALSEKMKESLPIKPQWSIGKYERYVVASNTSTLTFLHCGPHIHRPFQADQLHLDIWIDGRNMLRDAGTYQYNLPEGLQHYFIGTKAHNTILIDDQDQMVKGNRFIWYNWIKKADCQFVETDQYILIEGKFEGFKEIKTGLYHHRKVTVYKDRQKWIIEDLIEGIEPHVKVFQYWHPHPLFSQNYTLQAFDAEGVTLRERQEVGWYSEVYSQIEKVSSIYFQVSNSYIKTIVEPQKDK
jgi:hypothetical protein